MCISLFSFDLLGWANRERVLSSSWCLLVIRPLNVMKMVKENEVKFVDFRFTDTRGKEQHVTVPVSHFDEDKFTSGHAFDGWEEELIE